MFGNRTERTSPETATHDIDGKADHFPCRNGFPLVSRVRASGIRQAEYAIHLFHRQRQGWWIQPDIALAMRLNQCTGIARIGFQMHDARCMRVQNGIVHDLFIRWQADNGLAVRFQAQTDFAFPDRFPGSFVLLGFRTAHFLLGKIGIGMFFDRPRLVETRRIDFQPVFPRFPAFWHHVCRTAQIADRFDFFSRSKTMRQLDNRPLGIAVHKDVGLGIGKHGTPDLVRPVIVMRDATKTRFNRTDHHRYSRIGFLCPLRVNDQRTIGTFSGFSSGCIGVV